MPTLNPNLYTIAWIAPLEIEAQAALHMLDKIHAGGFPVGPGDDYVFHAGEICGHNVVIATFATVQPYGTSSVTSLASYIRKHFPNLWFGLLVGVAAGLPNLTSSPPRDIRLGDILVAQPVAESPAIIPYGLGKQKGGMGFELLPSGHSLPQAERIVRSTIAKIKAVNQDTEAVLGYYKMMADTTTKFPDPGQENDTLCLPGDNIPVRRERRRDTERIRVWYGPLGSGDKLLKSSRDRDELRDRYNLIGLETEAAGVMNEIPVGNIRGVCDYGNEQKNKDWQPFAAVMAAAFTKVVLSEIPPKSAVPSIVPRIVQVFTVEDKACLRDLLVTNPEDERQRIEDTKGALLNDSFRWILDNAEFRNWHCNPQSQVLWIKGNPGTGKTMLIIGIIKELLRQKQPQSSRTIAYFLCQATDPKLNNATGVLRGLIYMMIDQQPHLVSHLRKRYESEPKLFENGDLFYSLSVIFENMVRDSKHTTIYLLIDALDECEVDLRRLIMLIRKPCPNSQVDVKWIVSSRNRDDIKQLINFDNGEVKLSLDLNARYLSDATHISMNESPVLEYSQFLRRERTSIEPTDSGYASTTHQKDLPQEGYRTKYIHDVQRTVPGEEGFSSAPAAASRGKTEDDDGDDTESIYTAGPGISSSGQRSYICELVDDLFRKIQHGQETQHIPERIHGILSRLLKAFAMRFGQFGSTQIHLDIMVFIRRHRGYVLPQA
ncbi:5'-methylthioadenosine/S-adenosylhomocysteine nucleosidase family protein [Aspergillus melleus]|uniref:5'-methylthioadenosine/S-adenosylhomocysteine nucleosidase family protein n=1 Tax=Aspergillus melleus TaxID=138277 RepID=UPI001E8D30D5|nr:uncharacterized protein LDX57_013048 [Aspergillus melleus]KAH8435418.1 hypothetical protein LDX57_013048 [Aspergillus melleus]